MENINNKQTVKDRVFAFFSFFKDGKYKTILVIVLSFVVVGVFISSFVGGKSISKQNSESVEEKSCSAEEYCKGVENRLNNILASVKGVGSVEVFVMVDSSPTIKFLEETSITETGKGDDNTKSIQTKIVMSKNGNITMPVVVVEQLPKITGVLVVAKGAKDVKLKTTLINVISSVLSVNVSNVEVLEGK